MTPIRLTLAILLFLLAVAAPVAGIGVTVIAMIGAFNQTAAASSAASSQQLADGISAALFWPIAGLGVSVVCIVAGVLLLLFPRKPTDPPVTRP